VNLKEFWQWATTDTSKLKSSSTKPRIKSGVKKLVKPVTMTKTKKLGSTMILFILINSILGSSLFYLPSLGVINSGAASIIAWALLFVMAVFIMFYIGELVVLYPTSGGTYEFCKQAYGRFGSFMAGWLIWIAGNFGMALSIVAAAQYFIPNDFVLQMVFAVIWIVVLNFMAFRGVDAGSTMLVVFGVIATILVGMMTIPSFIDLTALFGGKFATPFSIDYLSPFFRQSGLGVLSFLGLSLLLISEAFLGFEVITYMANEVEDVKKLPRLLIKAIIISGVIMLIYVVSSLGTVPYTDYVQDARPFAVQAFNVMGEFWQQIVVFGMYLVIIGAAAAWPITGSRLIQAMAKDKLFLSHLSKLHSKHNSPYKAVIFQAIAVSLFSWFIFRGEIMSWADSYRSIYMIYVVLSLIVLSLILLTVPILRHKQADKKRTFKAPLGHIGPFFLITLFIILIINWVMIEGGVATSILNLAGSFIILGLPFYFMIEMFYDPKAIIRVNEFLSAFVILGERFFFPFSIRNKIFKEMGDLKGKSILEFGCAGGTLTKKIAEKVTKRGKIYAVDLSQKKVKIADKRTKSIDHVSVFHHPELNDFKLKLSKKVDGILSIGMLSYMQNPKKVLTSLGKKIKKGGEIIFVDYDKFFYIIPNVAWIEDDKKLKDIFKQSGFTVDVERRKSLLWQHIVITGVKD
jgi:amino acid transporter